MPSRGLSRKGRASFLFFLPHPSSPARRFSKITPVPSLPLKRGSTSPSAPPPQKGAPTGKPAVWYSQTSARPKGLLVEFYAIELRVFDAIELRVFDAIELRVFMRGGRGCRTWRFLDAKSASVYAPGRVIMRGGRRGARHSRSWCRW